MLLILTDCFICHPNFDKVITCVQNNWQFFSILPALNWIQSPLVHFFFLLHKKQLPIPRPIPQMKHMRVHKAVSIENLDPWVMVSHFGVTNDQLFVYGIYCKSSGLSRNFWKGGLIKMAYYGFTLLTLI